MISLDLTGQRLLVLGASSGIGRSVAEQAAGAGARVVAVGRRAELLESLASGVVGVAADLRDPDACAAVVDRAVAELGGGGLDAVVHALGVSPLAELLEAGPEVWTDTFATNVLGPAMVTRAALPHMAVGSVVAFVSSESVGTPRRGLVPYSVSKAALEEQIRGWRVEHPEQRFARLVVGATMGTDFPRDFNNDRFHALFNEWVANGDIATNVMECDQIAAALLEVLAVALAHPTVDLTDAVMVPPGPKVRPNSR